MLAHVTVDLGLLLGTEAPGMTPDGVDFSCLFSRGSGCDMLCV